MSEQAGALAGVRVLLIGASAGIGRALAIHLVGAGANVVLAARRGEELDKTVAEASGGHPVATDITVAEDCARLAGEAERRLGGIDVLLSSVGAAPLRMMADTSAQDWRQTLDTNVVGFHQIVQACLGTLAPHAVVGVLSSESVNQPRIALGAYAVSKVALERAVDAWRLEHPALRFCRIRVGQTIPTDFGSAFEPELLGRAFQGWAERGLIAPGFLSPADVAETICGMLAVTTANPRVGVEELTIHPSAAAAGLDHTPGQ